MNSEVDPREAKAILRGRLMALRQSLLPEAYREASDAICAQLETLPEIKAARVLSVYWPLVDRHEVDTRPLISRLVDNGARVLLPAVGQARPVPTIEHREFVSQGELVEGKWGLLEPAGPAVPPDEIDAVVVPAVGAGRNLHRIGFGAGYYDALLTQLRVPAIAAVFATCLLDEVPHERHDVPLTAIVTELEVIRKP